MRLKRWICAVLASVCAVAAVVATGMMSEAGHLAKYASISPEGDIILTTYDHRKTTSVHYRTIGWTVTRCILGTKTPVDDEYFTIRINDAVDGGEDEWMTTTFTIPEAEVMSRIAAVDGSWLADIQGDSEQPYLWKNHRKCFLIRKCWK